MAGVNAIVRKWWGMNGASAHLRLIRDEVSDGAWNMAVDELLLRSQIQKKNLNPILRFYRFREPAMTVGYGMWSSVQKEMNGNASFIRRMTGGGIVAHSESDLTYSLIVPLGVQTKLRKVRESYFLIHEELRKTLSHFGIRAELFDRARGKEGTKGSFCFASPVSHDVMLTDHKVAGAGQKRTQGYLLHQGSILWSLLIKTCPNLSEPDFVEQFSTRLARLLGCPVQAIPMGAEELEQTFTFARNGYAGTTS